VSWDFRNQTAFFFDVLPAKRKSMPQNDRFASKKKPMPQNDRQPLCQQKKTEKKKRG
jgi:hypothetical protein